MDNVCHTLVGAAFAEAGLQRAARYGRATLVIAANLPDIDVLVFATGLPSVAFRRGWTHGVLAQALLPVVLAGVMWWLAGNRRGRRSEGPDCRARDFRGLLLLAYVGVLLHVFLDLLNNYGIRLLMPFSGRWFYGDAVFIVDIWLWLTLGAGVWLSWSRGRVRAARIALLIASIYIGVLGVSARAAREVVAGQWRARHGGEPRALMVGPVPITPATRAVIVDAGDAYATGRFTWFSRESTFDPRLVPKNDDHPAVRAAVAADRRMQAVLTWARFPYYEIESTADGEVVTLRDLRFGDRVGAARAVVAASRGSSRPADRSR